MTKTKSLLPVIFTIIIITGMTAASEILSEREIIFPEIAAIATGYLLAPQMTWKTNKIRTFLLTTLCAVSGLLIVRFMPGPVWLQMIAAYCVGQLYFMFSRTTFAPMISAIVLPVLLQSRSIFYFGSAVIFTLLILVFRVILEKRGICPLVEYDKAPLPDRLKYRDFLIRLGLAAVCVIPALLLDFRFAVAPPLLVAFTEFTSPVNKAVKTPVKTVVFITLCALTGSACRFFLTMTLGLPLTAAVLVYGILMVIYIKKLSLYIPPAGALGVLAMLIPASVVALYPLQILTGAAVFMILARALFHWGLYRKE